MQKLINPIDLLSLWLILKILSNNQQSKPKNGEQIRKKYKEKI